MWQMISNFPLMAYLALSGLTQDLKKDVRGLSGVVVTVLLILVAVLAVVMVWGFLEGWLIELWERITGAADEL